MVPSPAGPASIHLGSHRQRALAGGCWRGSELGISKHTGGLEIGEILTDGWTLICAGKLLCCCIEGDCVLFPLFQLV